MCTFTRTGGHLHIHIIQQIVLFVLSYRACIFESYINNLVVKLVTLRFKIIDMVEAKRTMKEHETEDKPVKIIGDLAPA